jgi:hypothetical protein
MVKTFQPMAVTEAGFSYLSEPTDVPMRTINLNKGQGDILIYKLKIQPILT